MHSLPVGSANPHPRVGVLPGEGGDISDQGQSDPLITPVKSRFPRVRKTVSPGGPVIQKRKFPGPAGILPQPVSTVLYLLSTDTLLLIQNNVAVISLTLYLISIELVYCSTRYVFNT